MKWIYADGGRSQYFKARDVGDCAVRAIANGTGKDYKEVYNALKELNGGKSCRNGTPKNVDKKYLKSIGWEWHPTMQIGQGCRVHLWDDDLPNGTLIVQTAHHLTCVKDGVLYDTWDCSGPTRCVYGYWVKPTKTPVAELRQKYGKAYKVWVGWNNAYEERLKIAKRYFEEYDYNNAEQWLGQAKEALKGAADARDEMEKLKRELKNRRAAFDEYGTIKTY